MEEMKLFAGLDMHTDSITGTIKDEAGNPVRVLKVETSQEGVKQLFDRLQKKHITAVFEASRNWPRYAELIAVIATARKMLTTIWHLLNKNEYYTYRDNPSKNGL